MENKIDSEINKALDCFKKQDYSSALKHFEDALEKKPNDPNILNNIGLCYAKLADSIKAEEYYLKALSIDSKLVQTYINLSETYYLNKRIAEAINILENAVTLIPDNVAIKHSLARFYIEDLRYDLAIDQLNEIIEISPKNYDAYWDLGNIHFELGDYESAIPCYEKVLEQVDNNSVIYYQTALAYEANDNIDKAISNHLKALAHNDKFHPAYRKLGILFMAKGQKKDALEYFNDYLKFDIPEEEKENIKAIIARITT